MAIIGEGLSNSPVVGKKKRDKPSAISQYNQWASANGIKQAPSFVRMAYKMPDWGDGYSDDEKTVLNQMFADVMFTKDLNERQQQRAAAQEKAATLAAPPTSHGTSVTAPAAYGAGALSPFTRPTAPEHKATPNYGKYPQTSLFNSADDAARSAFETWQRIASEPPKTLDQQYAGKSYDEIERDLRDLQRRMLREYDAPKTAPASLGINDALRQDANAYDSMDEVVDTPLSAATPKPSHGSTITAPATSKTSYDSVHAGHQHEREQYVAPEKSAEQVALEQQYNALRDYAARNFQQGSRAAVAQNANDVAYLNQRKAEIENELKLYRDRSYYNGELDEAGMAKANRYGELTAELTKIDNRINALEEEKKNNFLVWMNADKGYTDIQYQPDFADAPEADIKIRNPKRSSTPFGDYRTLKYTDYYDLMTDVEKQTVNYLAAHEDVYGKGAAADYVEQYLMPSLERRKYVDRKSAIPSGEDIGFGKGLGLWASSTFTKIVNDPFAGIELYGQKLGQEINGDNLDVPLSAYNERLYETRLADDILGETLGSDLNKRFGTVNIPLIGERGVGDAVGLATSAAQSAATYAFGLGGMGGVGLGGMALSKASSGFIDAYERTGDENKSLAYGAALGISEATFENLSLESLLNVNSGKTLIQVLKQGGVEFSEELLTEVADTVADEIINGDKAVLNLRIQELYENEHMSLADAREMAGKEWMTNLLFQAFAGGIQGTGSAVTVRTVNRLASAYNKALEKRQSSTQNAAQTATNGAQASTGTSPSPGTPAAAKEAADALTGTFKQSEDAETYAVNPDGERNIVTPLLIKNVGTDEASVTVRDAQGSTFSTPLSEVEFAANVGDDYAYAAGMANDEVANAFLANVGDAAHKEDIAAGMSFVYERASEGRKLESIQKSVIAQPLNEQQFRAAYDLGVNQRTEKIAQEQAAATERRKNLPFKVGTIDYGDIDMASINETQRERATIAADIISLSGVNVHLFESKPDAEGIFRGTDGELAPNGYYVGSTGDIFLDINAGRNISDDVFEQSAIVAVAAHEMTHRAKAASPALYNQYVEAAMWYMEQDGVDVDALIDDVMSRDKSVTTREIAMEEIAANVAAPLLGTTDFVDKLYAARPQQALTLGQKIVEFIKTLKDRIARAYKGVTMPKEARLVMKNLDEIGKLWSGMMADAARLNETEAQEAPAEAAPVAEEAPADAGVRYSVRERDAEYLAAVERGDMEAAQKMVDEAAKAAGFNIRGYHRTNSKFTIFNKSLSGSNQGNTLGRGFYIAVGNTRAYDNADYGKYRMEVYAKSLNPFREVDGLSASEAAKVLDEYAATKHNLDEYDGLYRNHAMRALQDSYKMFNYLDEYAKDNGIGTDDILKSLGYDSVRSGQQLVVFDSSQIKSADPVTYSDDGSVIPLSERFNAGNEDIRYSVRDSGEVDSEGNRLSEAQARFFRDSQVRDADGNLQIVYHSTFNEFTEFSRDRLGENTDDWSNDELWAATSRVGSWFSTLDLTKKAFKGGRKLTGYLNITSPLEYASIDEFAYAIDERGGADKFVQYMRQNSYDGVVISTDEELGGTSYVALDSVQFKNADNKAPTPSPDIRYSAREVPLERRVKGDALLDAQDVIDELLSVGARVSDNGYVSLYHRTSSDAAAQIRKSGIMRVKEDGVFFSTATNGQAEGYGDTVVEFRIPAERIEIDDIFDKEAHVRYPTGSARTINLSQYIVNDGVRYSQRDPEDISTREVLATALEGAAQNERERNMLASYKEQIKKYDGIQKDIAEKRARIRELTFGKYERTTATRDELAKLKNQVSVLWDQLSRQDSTLLKLEAMEPLKTLGEREQSKAVAKVRAEMNERIKAIREQRDAKVEQAKQEGRERVQRMREGRKETEIRGKIKEIIDDLNKRLLTPVEGRYVPKEFTKLVVELGELVQTRSKEPTSAKVSDKLAAIRTAYIDLKVDPGFGSVYNEAVEELIKNVAGLVQGKTIYQLDSRDLEELYVALRAARKMIVDAVKVFGDEKKRTATALGVQGIEELRRSRGNLKLEKAEKFFSSLISTRSMFMRFGNQEEGGAWETSYKILNEGGHRVQRIIMDANAIFKDVIEGKANQKELERLQSIKPGDLVDVGLKDKDGNAVKITRDMMLELYKDLMNDQNIAHVMYGGMTSPDLKKFYDGDANAWGQSVLQIAGFGARFAELEKRLDAATTDAARAAIQNEYNNVKAQGDAYIASMRDVISGMLTPYEKRLLDAMHQYYDVYSKDTLNKVTEELYGFKKATIDNYFPIRTNKNFRKANFETITRDFTLANSGFMKSRVNASNPILLGGILETTRIHIQQMAQYAGLVIPLSDFSKIYSTTLSGYSDSLQNALVAAFDKNATTWVENYLADLNHARKREHTVFDAWRGRYAKAILTANISSALKQVTAYPTAASVVGWGPTLKALARGGRSNAPISRANRALIDRYSTVLYSASRGLTSAELGDVRENMKWGARFNKAIDFLQKLDVATRGRMWDAARYYVDENFAGLEKGTREQIDAGESPYYKKVAEVFDKVVEDTQQSYSASQLPDILRSPNALIRSMTMFMTQPLKNLGVIYDATANMRAKARAVRLNDTKETRAQLHDARVRFANSVSAQVTAMIFEKIMSLAGMMLLYKVNPLRDDDDDITWESVLEWFGWDTLNSVLGSFAFGRELSDTIQAFIEGKQPYEIEVMGVNSVSDFVQTTWRAWNEINKMATDKDYEWPEDFRGAALKWGNGPLARVATSVGNLAGIPVGNVMNILKSGYFHAVDAAEGALGSFEAGIERTDKYFYGQLYDLAAARDKTGFQTRLAEVMDEREVTESDALSGVRSAIGEAYVAGEIDALTANALLADYVGERDKDRKKTLGEWNYKRDTGESYADMKELYLDGSLTLSQAVEARVKYGMIDKAAATETVNQWRYELDTGRKWDEMGSDMLNGKITEAAAKNYLTKYGGKSNADANEKINEWIYEDETGRDFTRYSYVYDALDAGSKATFNTAVSDMVSDYGMEREDVVKQAASHIKTLVGDGELTPARALSLRESVLGETFTDVERQKEMNEYNYIAANGSKEGYTQYGKYTDAMLAAAKKGDTAAFDKAKQTFMDEMQFDEDEAYGNFRETIRVAFKKGEMNYDTALSYVENYGGQDADEAYWTLQSWQAKNDGAETFSKNDKLYEAVLSGTGYDAAVKELLAHGSDDSDITTATRSAIKKAYVEGEIDFTKATALLKKHKLVEDENDVYWQKREWDYAKANGTSEGYGKYKDFLGAVESGTGVSKYAKELLDHGVKKSSIASAIAGEYKDEYIALKASNPNAAAAMLEWILDGYEAIGYSRSYERNYISKNWK